MIDRTLRMIKPPASVKNKDDEEDGILYEGLEHGCQTF